MSGFIARNKLILSFVTLNVTSGTAAGLLHMILPLYALTLNATTVQIGLLRGVSGIGMTLLVIPAGFLVDHFGSKKLFVLGSLVGAFIAISLVLAKTPTTMILLMGLMGFFGPMKFTAISAAFFRSLSEMGQEKAGWFKGSMSIGLTFFGPVIGGLLSGSTDFTMIFGIVFVIMLIPTALVFIFHNETPRPGPVSGLWEVTKVQLQDFKLLVRQRSIYLILCAETLAAASISTFNTFILLFIVRTLNLKPAIVSVFLVLEGASFILTIFLAGPLVCRMTMLNASLLGYGISALGLTCLALANNLFWMALATVVLGLGLGLINVFTSYRIGEMKEEKGKVVGLFAAATGIGISFGPLTAGLVGEYLGNRLIFFTYVPFFLLLSLAVLWNETREDVLESESVNG